MGAAATVRAVHVPEPRGSGVIAAVVADAKPTTLASALREAGVSQSALAQACGVSQQRVAQWLSPESDATPNLRHIHDMPRSVRRALGQALLDAAEGQVVPLPAAVWERALLGCVARVAAVAARIEESKGDRRAAAALLRELAAARDDLARLEAGVRAVMGGER